MNENPYAAPKNNLAVDISVQLPITETVVMDAEVLSRYQAGWAGWLRFMLRIVAAVVGSVGCFVAGLFFFKLGPSGSSGVKLIVTSVLGVPGVFLVAWAIWARRVSVWTLQHALIRSGRGSETVRYTITEDYLKIEVDSDIRNLRWDALVAVQRHRHFLVLKFNDGQVQLFPTEQLSPEFMETLQALAGR